PRRCAAHSGCPAWSATTPRAAGSLAPRDGSAVAHHPLSIRPASAARFLLRARPLAARIRGSGKAAHRESRRVYPPKGSHALVPVLAAHRRLPHRVVGAL